MKKTEDIYKNMRVLFLADKFDDEMRDDVSRFPGGAELTDAALIESCPWDITKKKFVDLNEIDTDSYDILIIGNSKTASSEQIDLISSNTRYILFEHDMRICRYDGDFLRAKKEPVHYFAHKCICPHLNYRKLYKNSIGIIFLSWIQHRMYYENPFFNHKNIIILGSPAFNKEFFNKVERSIKSKEKKDGFSVFKSPHLSKGFKQSKEYCLKKGVTPIEIADKNPNEVLEIFEKSEKFVFLPMSIEGAGRMPVEARFLGCDVVVNDKVGVAGESWWNLPDDIALEFLKDTPHRFWRIVEDFIKNENID